MAITFPASSRSVWIHFVGYVVAFLVGGIATCVALKTVENFQGIAQVADKWNQFRTSAGRYNAVFLGSSKTYSGVIPAAFDEYLNQHQRGVHAFNFGIDGMGFPESGYLCDQLLNANKGSLRWIFLELVNVRTRVLAAHKGTRRSVYWHDWRRTRLVTEALVEEQRREGSSPATLRSDISEHLRLFFRRFLCLGDGAERVKSLLLPADLSRRGRDDFRPEDHGYFPIWTPFAPSAVAGYQHDLKSFLLPKQKNVKLVSERALLALHKRAAAAGVELVFVVPPSQQPVPIYFSQVTGVPPAILSFEDPARFPELYALENRGDPTHLNDVGAHRYTRLLAEAFAAHLQKKSPPPSQEVSSEDAGGRLYGSSP